MLLKQLKYFVEIVNCNNFREASENLYISQSAISQAIQSLEEELGFKLLIREKRSFTTTKAGNFVYNQAKRIIKECESLKEKGKEISLNENTLKIGYLRTYVGKELRNTITKLLSFNPNLDIRIYGGTHDELNDMLFQDKIDCKFCEQRKAFSNRFLNEKICNQGIFIRISVNHKLSNKDKVELDELKEFPIILVSSKEQEENERKFYMDTLGFEDNFIFVDNIDDAEMLVLSSKGIMPVEKKINYEIKEEGIKYIPVFKDDVQMNRDFFLFCKKDNVNKEIEKMVEILKEQFT